MFKRSGKVVKHIVLIFYCIITLIPFIWMLSASFKSPEHVLTVPTKWIPPVWQPGNYPEALLEPRFAGYSLAHFILNSFFVAMMTTLFSIFLSIFCGYGFAKFKFKGRDAIMWTMLSMTLLPFSAVVIPLYLIIRTLGLLDNLWALIVPFALTGQNIFLARQFILTLPSELIDTARVDGAGEFHIFWRIIFPLLGPASASLGIMTFLFSWNLFLWPMVVLSSQEHFTLPLGLSLMGMGSTFLIDYHLWMAASTLAVLPPLILFVFLQRYYLRGLETLSGFKG